MSKNYDQISNQVAAAKRDTSLVAFYANLEPVPFISFPELVQGKIKVLIDEWSKGRGDSRTSAVYNLDLPDVYYLYERARESRMDESYGTAHDYENSSQVYAGKTGTTNDNKDAWFCGYSQYYTTAVWCGCDIPQSASGLYGSSYPAVIWSDFMDSLHEGLEKAEFEVPDTVVLADSRGNTKDIDYDTDIYDSRPSGYDYMSAEYAEQMLDELQENYRNSLRETIKFLLESFETMDVTSSSDEESVESAYENLISSINELDDGTEKDSYRSRADSRYQLLMSELENLEEEEEESRLSGASTSAVAEVNSYIQQLNQLSYYTEETETLIEEAEDALGDVYGTDSYADLSFRLEAAISYARSLPRRD